MTPSSLQQRCWNHEDREAVCRCPECGRTFCRECVGEHEMRLLCAGCLKAAALATRRAPKKRRLARPVMVVAGLVIAWVAMLCAGEAVMTVSGRWEQTSWQRR